MDRIFHLNDIAMMTGFTTRTLRTYLNQGLLRGTKTGGVWEFTAEDLDRFFREPFIKEGLRIKRSSVVFDFMSDRSKKTRRACVILDLPASAQDGSVLSAFFCGRMQEASDVVFNFDWHNGMCRVILSGAEDQVAKIMRAYGEAAENGLETQAP